MRKPSSALSAKPGHLQSQPSAHLHLHDVGAQNGISYLVMEHLQGRASKRGSKRAPAAKAGIGMRRPDLRCAGKSAPRRHSSPRSQAANIMMTAAGAKLLDFGLAKPPARLLARRP